MNPNKLAFILLHRREDNLYEKHLRIANISFSPLL